MLAPVLQARTPSLMEMKQHCFTMGDMWPWVEPDTKEVFKKWWFLPLLLAQVC